ncbi:MAG: O-antigen ligase family protein [Proteobacteria bacterium]|nr:O-antigen ligase family protein [Pseudomonadota bacterium]
MRSAIAVGGTLLCFASLTLFYGSAVNPIVLLFAIFCLLTALSVVGASRLSQTLSSSPFAAGLAIAALVAIIVSYQFSLSKESSFTAAWALALAPLGFIMASGLSDRGVELLWRLISLLVLMFALVSVVNLFATGARAGLPLQDPNNYGSLLYLVALPWMHRYLQGASARTLQANQTTLLLGAILLVLTALFATQSRVSVLIVWVALAIWFGLFLSRRQPVGPVLACTLVTVAAYALFNAGMFFGSAVNDGVNPALNPENLGSGIEIRLALIRSALAMFLEAPLTGIGVFVFPLMYRIFRLPVDEETAGKFVHNDYVQFLTEGGVPLFAVAVLFALGLGLRFFRVLRSGDRSSESLGLLLALGGVAAHAAVNFVFYTPVLSLLIGLMAGKLLLHTEARAVTLVRDQIQIRNATWAALIFSWLVLGYLAIDTFSAGVFQNQSSVPFAQSYRQNPEQMLRYAKFAQQLNGSRGLPAYVEAALLEQQLLVERSETTRQSDYLQEQTLAAYRRAVRLDPWNTLALMSMYRFVVRHEIAPLEESEQPENLLLRSISIDPLFVPAIDEMIKRYQAGNRLDLGYRLLTGRVLPMLPYLVRQDPMAAKRYFNLLKALALKIDDQPMLAQLDRLEERLEDILPLPPAARWFF